MSDSAFLVGEQFNEFKNSFSYFIAFDLHFKLHTHINKKNTFFRFFFLHNIQTVYRTNSMSMNFFQWSTIKFGDNALSEFNKNVLKYWVNICQVLCYCMLCKSYFFSPYLFMCHRQSYHYDIAVTSSGSNCHGSI